MRQSSASGEPLRCARVSPVSERVRHDWAMSQFWWAHRKRRLAADWHLRGATVGPNATVHGWPRVDATDLVVGAEFRIWSVYRRTFITGWGRMRFGDRCFVNSGVVLNSVLEIVVEDDVAIANEAYITDTNSHGTEGRPPKVEPVRIGRGSWVGARAIILPGVTIGPRCVVAAGAVVSRDVPADSLVAGNPAQVVRPLVYPDGCVRAWQD